MATIENHRRYALELKKRIDDWLLEQGRTIYTVHSEFDAEVAHLMPFQRRPWNIWSVPLGTDLSDLLKMIEEKIEHGREHRLAKHLQNGPTILENATLLRIRDSETLVTSRWSIDKFFLLLEDVSKFYTDSGDEKASLLLVMDWVRTLPTTCHIRLMRSAPKTVLSVYRESFGRALTVYGNINGIVLLQKPTTTCLIEDLTYVAQDKAQVEKYLKAQRATRSDKTIISSLPGYLPNLTVFNSFVILEPKAGDPIPKVPEGLPILRVDTNYSSRKNTR